MRRTVLTVLAGSAVTVLSGQAPATPGFKLGTFERKDTPFVGVVLRDAVVIDLAAADTAVMPGSSVAAPRDMKDLIARYDKGVRSRILELIARVDAAGAVRPSWVIDLSSLKTLPPIMYPQTMLNMAVNYREHAAEMAGAASSPTGPGAALPGTRSAPGIWDRQAADTRWNPYLFTKLPSAVIAAGESIRLPVGRAQIEQLIHQVAPHAADEAAHCRAAPARFVAEHVVAHEIRDGLHVTPRECEAGQHPLGQSRALRIVADEMAVGQRGRLADVVDKRREAQPDIARSQPRGRIGRGQAVRPQVHARCLVLGDAALRIELRQCVLQDPGIRQDRQRARRFSGVQDLAQLVTDSLRRNVLNARGRRAHRGQGRGLDLEVELRRQPRGPQQPQRVLVKAHARVAHRAQQARM